MKNMMDLQKMLKNAREMQDRLQKEMEEKNEVPVVLLPLLAEGDAE
jgi:DNA-binding protein YbaB